MPGFLSTLLLILHSPSKSPMAPSRRSKDFVLEGGKYPLAEALHDAFRFKIRCPDCVGNPLKPGFNKDEAGKRGKDGQPRRQWACQYSNTRSTSIAKCGRVTCTEYIELARKQLGQTQFAGVLQRVCQRFPPEREEYAALQGYSSTDISQSTTHATPASSLVSQNLPRKRKAEEELPFLDKTTRHSQIQERQESRGSDTSSLQSTLQHLESMIEMSKTWQEQHRMLTIFLASSSPPQPTPSSETPSWSSPNLAPKHIYPSDATIPCTYPEEDGLSSSPPNPSSDPTKQVKEDLSSSIPEPPSKSTSPLKVYVRGVVFKRSYDPTPPPEVESRSPTHESSNPSSHPTPLADIHSSPPIPPVKLSSYPMDRVRALVQRFKQARNNPTTATEQRRAIRQQARAEGLLASFQALLKQGDPPSDPISELKCSERT